MIFLEWQGTSGELLLIQRSFKFTGKFRPSFKPLLTLLRFQNQDVPIWKSTTLKGFLGFSHSAVRDQQKQGQKTEKCSWKKLVPGSLKPFIWYYASYNSAIQRIYENTLLLLEKIYRPSSSYILRRPQNFAKHDFSKDSNSSLNTYYETEIPSLTHIFH